MFSLELSRCDVLVVVNVVNVVGPFEQHFGSQFFLHNLVLVLSSGCLYSHAAQRKKFLSACPHLTAVINLCKLELRDYINRVDDNHRHSET